MKWDVKMFLAKIKDCKGKELRYTAKKKLPTKIPPKSVEKAPRQLPATHNLIWNKYYEAMGKTGGFLPI